MSIPEKSEGEVSALLSILLTGGDGSDTDTSSAASDNEDEMPTPTGLVSPRSLHSSFQEASTYFSRVEPPPPRTPSPEHHLPTLAEDQSIGPLEIDTKHLQDKILVSPIAPISSSIIKEEEEEEEEGNNNIKDDQTKRIPRQRRQQSIDDENLDEKSIIKESMGHILSPKYKNSSKSSSPSSPKGFTQISDVFPSSAASKSPTPGAWQDPHAVRRRNMKMTRDFLSTAFENADSMIGKFASLQTPEHPLDDILYHSMMTTREILSCWSLKELHDVALESVMRRNKNISEIVSKMDQNRSIRLEGVLDKLGTHRGFSSRRVVWRMNRIESYFRGSKDVKINDLNQLIDVEDVHNGKESLFNLIFADKGNLFDSKKGVTVQYRAKSDAEKQRWMSCFRIHVKINYFRKILDHMNARDSANLMKNILFHPFESHKKMYEQFLFLTSDTKNKVESKLRDRKNREKVNFYGLPVPIEFDVDEDEEEREEVIPQYGVRERFKVMWPQVMGKAKQRELEISLCRPHSITVYKPKKTATKHDRNDMEEVGVVFYRHNLIDYHIREEKLQIELYFGTSKNEHMTYNSMLSPSEQDIYGDVPYITSYNKIKDVLHSPEAQTFPGLESPRSTQSPKGGNSAGLFSRARTMSIGEGFKSRSLDLTSSPEKKPYNSGILNNSSSGIESSPRVPFFMMSSSSDKKNNKDISIASPRTPRRFSLARSLSSSAVKQNSSMDALDLSNDSSTSPTPRRRRRSHHSHSITINTMDTGLDRLVEDVAAEEAANISDKEVLHKKFIFSSLRQLDYFVELLQIFQLPPGALNFELYHQDTLHAIQRAKQPNKHTQSIFMSLVEEKKHTPQVSIPETPEKGKRKISKLKEAVLRTQERLRLEKNKIAAKDTVISPQSQQLQQQVNEMPSPLMLSEGSDRPPRERMRTLSPASSIPEEDLKISSSTCIFTAQLHFLFETMERCIPGHPRCVRLIEKSAKLPFTLEGDISRLQLLCVMLYEFDEDRTECLCPLASKVDELRANEEKAKRLIQSAKNGCKMLFIRTFYESQGLSDIHRYLKSSTDPKLQAWGIRIIWRVLEVKHLIRECSGLMIRDESVYKGPFENLPFFEYVNVTVRYNLLSIDSMNVLFEILIGECKKGVMEDAEDQAKDVLVKAATTKPHAKQRKLSVFIGASKTHILSTPHVEVLNKKIVHRQLIPFVMHALSRSEDSACEMGLQNIVLLLKDPANSMFFLYAPDWQSCFFPLLVMPAKNEEIEWPFLTIDFVESEPFCLTMTMITNLHFQYINLIEDAEQVAKEVKFQWKSRDGDVVRSHVLFQTVEKFTSFVGFNKYSSDVVSLIFVSLFSILKSRARKLTHNFEFESLFPWQSVISCILSAEEYLFCTPFTTTKPLGEFPKVNSIIGLHTDDKGSILASDIKIVDRALDMLKVFNFHKDVKSFTHNMSPNEQVTMHMGCFEYVYLTEVKTFFTKYNNAKTIKTREDAFNDFTPLFLDRHKKFKKRYLTLMQGTPLWKCGMN